MIIYIKNNSNDEPVFITARLTNIVLSSLVYIPVILKVIAKGIKIEKKL